MLKILLVKDLMHSVFVHEWNWMKIKTVENFHTCHCYNFTFGLLRVNACSLNVIGARWTLNQLSTSCALYWRLRFYFSLTREGVLYWRCACTEIGTYNGDNMVYLFGI